MAATAFDSLKIEPSNLDVPRSDSARSFTILATVGIIGVALIGLLLRLWILGRQPVGSPTAIPGLMAHEILHGHFFAFYWGQNYGGVDHT